MPTDYQPDYRKSEIAGSEWTRCLHVECDNPYIDPDNPNGQTPKIRFDEERRLQLAGGTNIGVPAGSVTEEFTDPSILFPLLDPATGELLGQDASYGALYAMLFSLYMHLAHRRDAGNAVPQDDPPVDGTGDGG